MSNTQNDANPVSASQVLKAANLALLSQRMLLIEGQGGGGKTSIVSNIVAPGMGREMFYVNLCGTQTPEALGYGKPESDGTMKFYAPEMWPTYDRVGDTPVLLYLDEFSEYDPAVLSLLRALHPATGHRYVGTHKLGTDIFIVATTNRRQDGTGARTIAAPMIERVLKVTLDPNVADWIEWYDTQQDLVASKSHVPSFLRMGQIGSNEAGNFFNPPIVIPFDGNAHPCPRQWEAVARLEPIRKYDPTMFKVGVRGLVGARAADTFLAFLSHVDSLPDVESLRKNAEGFKVPSDPAAQYALVSACLNTGKLDAKDQGVAVQLGQYDWLVSLLLRCRGDIREYGALSAVRRGIPLDRHDKSSQLIVG